MNKLVIFDFDGTIADSFETSQDLIKELNSKLKIIPEQSLNFEDFRSLSSEDFISNLNLNKIKLYYYLFRFKIELQKNINNLNTFEGMDKVIKELYLKGYTLGIVTSNFKGSVKKFLKNKNLNYFDFVISNPFLFRKDKVFNKILRLNKIDKTKVYYIGDETRDIVAAKKSKINMISCSWGYNFENVLREYNPDYLVSYPEEILNIL